MLPWVAQLHDVPVPLTGPEHLGQPGWSLMGPRSWLARTCVNIRSGPGYARPMKGTRVACVGAIVRDDRGRLLLVRRGTAPGKGRWSIPGGRVEAGEGATRAAVREVQEETGLRVRLTGLAGVVEVAGPAGVVYEVKDFHALVEPGTDSASIRAGDDAADVAWFSADQLETLDCVEGLLDALRRWQVAPSPR